MIKLPAIVMAIMEEKIPTPRLKRYIKRKLPNSMKNIPMKLAGFSLSFNHHSQPKTGLNFVFSEVK
tara:strand:- start:270 stop:467 length:198 start_codon:yes stop_codon:yes gene_type:complete